MWGWLRSPAVHFLIIGGLLFVGFDLVPDLHRQTTGRMMERAPVILSSARVRELRSEFVRRWGSKPTPQQWRAAIQQAVDDEILYREARLLSLERDDHSIRRRLVQKMRALSMDPKAGEEDLYREARRLELDDDLVIRRILREKMRILLQQDPNGVQIDTRQVEDYIERHRQQFAVPARVTFSHVFFSASAQGGTPIQKAKTALTRLRSRSILPELSEELSEPFLLGHRMRGWTPSQVARRFGESFAEAVFALPPAAWYGPIASSYGLHLVWVHDKATEALPPLETIRERAVRALQEERSAMNFARGLQRLRALYEIRIEDGESYRSALATPEKGS